MLPCSLVFSLGQEASYKTTLLKRLKTMKNETGGDDSYCDVSQCLQNKSPGRLFFKFVFCLFYFSHSHKMSVCVMMGIRLSTVRPSEHPVVYGNKR